MKQGYPVKRDGGVSQQPYEIKTRMQRKGIKKLIQRAGICVEGLRKIVDLGCRNGDTTLGLLEMTKPDNPREREKTRIIGIDEERDAILIAKAKFGIANAEELTKVRALITKIPKPLRQRFYVDANGNKNRVCFHRSDLVDILNIVREVDLVVGSQLLHWIDAGVNGLPKVEILRAISDCLVSRGTFITSTSTAFVEVNPKDLVDRKTLAEYSIDEHPFVKMFYKILDQVIVENRFRANGAISGTAVISMGALRTHFHNGGFGSVEFGSYLITPGREEVISSVLKIRAEHQGRLSGVSGKERNRIISEALRRANLEADHMVTAGEPDPRLVETNIWDVVPWVKAVKL